jgi:hypothetical protein
MKTGTNRAAGVAASLTLLAGIALVAQSPAPSFSRDVAPILQRECAKCHGEKEQKAKLDLAGPEAYKSLVNVPSREEQEILRVKPGDPEGSYLWLKLEHRTAKGSGMPKGLFFASHLNEKDMTVIRQWILEGAKE